MFFFGDEKKATQKKFWKAVCNRNLPKMREAIAAGADIAAKSEEGYCALYSAAHCQFEDGVRELIRLGADLNEATRTGKTPLMTALDSRYASIANILIGAGADVNVVRSDNGWTALHYAATEGLGDIVKLLVEEKGMDPGLKDSRMQTPAMLAEKYFKGITNYLNERTKEEPKAEIKAGESWCVTGEHEISIVKDKPDIGYRLTEIFNFDAHSYTHIVRDLQSGTQSHVVKDFSEVSTHLVDTARKEMAARSVSLPEDGRIEKIIRVEQVRS